MIGGGGKPWPENGSGFRGSDAPWNLGEGAGAGAGGDVREVGGGGPKKPFVNLTKRLRLEQVFSEEQETCNPQDLRN